MMLFRALLVLILALSACGPRPGIVLKPQASRIGQEVEVFYSSTRAPQVGPDYGIARAYSPTYGRLGVSIPPGHTKGTLEMTGRSPDPAKDFTATTETVFDGAPAFRRALSQALRRQSGNTREAVIFVHGFNNTFAEGMFRLAQLRHDFGIEGVAIGYSWPSRGNPLAYAYDRDSVLFARDGLEKLIREVKAAGATSILLVGHSLGAELSMEAMRDMAIKSGAELRRDIDAVILISPDIDVQVFRAQAARIGRLPEPFVIFVSKKDRALALSARLTGERNRLGNSDSISQVSDLSVTMIDLTDFSNGLDLGHFTLGDSPALVQILSQLPGIDALIKGDTAGRTDLLTGTMLTVQNATQIVLSPIVAVGSQ